MERYLKNIAEFGKQLSPQNITSLNLGALGSGFDLVVIVGMGGSGAIGEMIKNTAKEIGLTLPVITVKNRTLPLLTKKPLLIFVSFSGNTAETFSALKEGLKTFGKKNVAVVAGGGKMKDFAIQNRLALASFSKGDLTPREASGIMYYGVSNILNAVHSAKVPQATLSAFSALMRTARKLASELDGKNILVYAPEELSHLARIWKNNFNETAKNASFTNLYPEINHNEVEGFRRMSGKWAAIFMGNFGPEEKRIKFLGTMMDRKGVRIVRFTIPGKSILNQTWNGLVISHLTCLALAEKHGDNPTEVDTITKLKKI